MALLYFTSTVGCTFLLFANLFGLWYVLCYPLKKTAAKSKKFCKHKLKTQTKNVSLVLLFVVFYVNIFNQYKHQNNSKLLTTNQVQTCNEC